MRKQKRIDKATGPRSDQSESKGVAARPGEARLRKELGIWVFQGPTIKASIPDLFDRMRDKRLRSLIYD
jgi:hypothetical protein